jgi:glycine betaine/proline transport system substrate-binding protein
MASVVEGLGYKPSTTIASVPITFSGIKSKQIDVFLGYWNPSMTAADRALRQGRPDQGAGYPQSGGGQTPLAVPDYVAPVAQGLRNDIAKFKDKLDGKIYGIEPGNDGNLLIDGMIKKTSSTWPVSRWWNPVRPACWPRWNAPSARKSGSCSWAGNRTR